MAELLAKIQPNLCFSFFCNLHPICHLQKAEGSGVDDPGDQKVDEHWVPTQALCDEQREEDERYANVSADNLQREECCRRRSVELPIW